MSGPVGVKPIRTDVDIRADLAELARWVNARDEDPSLLLFALATDVEPLLFRAEQAEAWVRHLTGETERWVQAVSELEAELSRTNVVLRKYMIVGPVDDLAAMKDQLAGTWNDSKAREAIAIHERNEAETRLAKVRALVAHAKNVSPSRSMTVYVTDLEAVLEGRT